MPRKSNDAPLTDLCTANVTSAAFVRTQADAKRRAMALIAHYFSIFLATAYPLMLGGLFG